MCINARIMAITIASGMFASSASAGLTAYSNQAAWEADLMSMGFTPITETFDGIEIPDMQPNGPFVINDDLSITVEGMMDTAGTANVSGGEFEGELFPDSGHSAYVHTFDTPVIAFGQFYEGAASGLGLQIETADGNVDILDFYSGFDDGFLGYIGSTPISSVRIIGGTDDTAVGEIYDAADVSYAFIPAPGSVALMGLGGLAAVRRRR